MVLDVPIYSSHHSSIIGHKGLTIVSLNANYNIRTMFPHLILNHYSHDNILRSGTHYKPSSINLVQYRGRA